MINTKVYNNGLKLVVEEMPNFESVCLYVMVIFVVHQWLK